eukprot:gene36424-43365_t
MNIPTAARRAIVCFVDDNPHLIQQARALRESWAYVDPPDTDLVMFAPRQVLERLPDDVVRVEQRSVAEDPEWFGYRYGNGMAYLNGANAYRIDQYTHVLHTDVDTFITPAWNAFRPAGFVCGQG